MPAEIFTKSGNDVATYVKRQFGDESGVQITDEDIVQWINIAQMELALENEFTKRIALRELTTGVVEYSFPEVQILLVQTIYADGKNLRYMSFQEFQEEIERAGKVDQKGTPEIWTEWGGTFRLWPEPENTVENGIKIYLIERPVDLGVLNDSLAVPDRLYSVLLNKVLAHAYNLEENFDAATLHNQMADSKLLGLSNYQERSGINEYPTITMLDDEWW